MTAHIARVLICHHRIVYLQDDVALLQPHLRRRHTLVGLVNDAPLQLLVVANQRSDTCILARQHLL